MTWHALHYPLKPDTHKIVGDLFKDSGRPSFDVQDESGQTVGRLLGTMAFVGPGKALRVIEVDGPLPLVAAHMGRQAEVRAFEDQLEEHLAVPRDMRSPDGARAFFREAAMENVLAFVPGEQGDPSEWAGVFYPVTEGHEDAVRDIAAGNKAPDLTVRDGGGAEVGQVRGMMFFVGRQKALRLIKVAGDIAEVGPHMSRQPDARAFQSALDEHLAVDRDTSDPDSANAFFADAWLECVLSRRHDKEL